MVKALAFDTPDFLSKDITNYDRTSLLYDRVWPFRYLPKVQDERKSIVMTLWSFAPYRGESTYAISNVTFYVIVYFDIIQTNEGLRTDFIFSEIESTRKKTELIGTSRFRLSESFRDTPVDSDGKWLGVTFGYSALAIS